MSQTNSSVSITFEKDDIKVLLGNLEGLHMKMVEKYNELEGDEDAQKLVKHIGVIGRAIDKFKSASALLGVEFNGSG